MTTDAEYAALFDGDPLGLGDGPLFPEAMGAILGDLLSPTPTAEQDGPPYVYTFRPPDPEYDENGNLLPPRIESTHTITKVDDDN